MVIQSLRTACLIFVVGVLPAKRVSAAEWQSQVLEQGKNKPLADLPEGVQAEKGKVTLYADFANAKDGMITLYLINRTGKDLSVPAQDGDPYAKLEARDAEGKWERAQAHTYSWCGNSYFDPPNVKDGAFLTIAAPYLAHGEKRQVRYRIFSDVGAVSNEGEGLVDPKVIENCRYDAMAIRYGDVKVVEHVLYSTPKTDEDKWPDLRGSAIRRLEYLPPAEATPLLKTLLIEIGLKDRYYRDVIRIMSKIAPQELASHAKEVFSEGPSPRRERLRAQSAYMQDPASEALMQEMARDPATPDAEWFLYAATRRKDEAARKLLKEIAEGSGYRRNLRDFASCLFEERFGKLPVHVGIRPVSSDGKWNTTQVEVTLKNEGEKELSFSYTRPEEIVGVWVTWSEPPVGERVLFVPIREDVRFFQGDDKRKPIRVNLHKGDEHSVRLDLRSLFDFSGCEQAQKHGFQLRPRVCLPGIQDVPALSNQCAVIRLP